MTTSMTGFEVEFLKECSHQMEVNGSSFEGIAEVYNALHENKDKLYFQNNPITRGKKEEDHQLNSQRLEEGWFLFRIASLNPVSVQYKWCTLLGSFHNQSKMEKFV